MRFGVVGTGHWARTVHVTGLAAHPDVELVGVWGRDLDRASAAAEPVGARAFDDVDALLDVVDVVAFAVPPSVQADLAARAARAGRHLLLEKPVAIDPAAADALVDAAADVRSLVFLTQRFVPEWEQWLTDRVAANPLGARVEWLAAHLAPDSPYADSQWRKDEGALWDIGPHVLSLLLPLLGPVVDVAALGGPGDLTHVALTHEGGGSSTFAVSLTMPPPAARRLVEVYDADGWQTRPDGPPDRGAAYAGAVTELLDSIETGVPHRCDVRFGRDIGAVLSRCAEALGSRSG